MELNKQKGVSIMTITVQKWGNSLAVRIPSVIAERLALHQGSEVEVIVENQAIKLIPKKKGMNCSDASAGSWGSCLRQFQSTSRA